MSRNVSPLLKAATTRQGQERTVSLCLLSLIKMVPLFKPGPVTTSSKNFELRKWKANKGLCDRNHLAYNMRLSYVIAWSLANAAGCWNCFDDIIETSHTISFSLYQVIFPIFGEFFRCTMVLAIVLGLPAPAYRCRNFYSEFLHGNGEPPPTSTLQPPLFKSPTVSQRRNNIVYIALDLCKVSAACRTSLSSVAGG